MPVAQVPQQVHQHLGILSVQVGRRFVGQNQLRVGGDRASHRHALLLSARQIGRPPVREVTQAQFIEHGTSPATPFGGSNALQFEDEFDVLAGRQHRDEIEGLKHESDLTQPKVGPLAVRQLDHIVTEYSQVSRRRRIQGTDQIQQRRLAAPGRPHQREKLAGAHLQVDTSKRLDLGRALAKHFPQPTGHDHAFAHGATLNAVAGSVRAAYQAGYRDATRVATIATRNV